MRILELFSGTNSVGKVAKELGHTVVSLDISPKYSPDFVADIIDFDFSEKWPKGYFDFVWASPPCEKYSIAPCQLFSADERAGRAEEGNAITRKTLEVIEYFEPTHFAIENPHSSLIWKQNILDHLPKQKVSYCMYGFPYRKHTFICSNVPFEPKVCRGDCGFVHHVKDAQGKMHLYHEQVAKQGVSAHCRGLGVQRNTHKRDELYRIPENLGKDILEAALVNLPRVE